MSTRLKYILDLLIRLVLVGAVIAFTRTALAWAAGQTYYWRSTNTGLPANADVESLAFSLNISHTLYAGTFNDGVFRSADHGATWTAINTGITMPLHIQNGLAVHPLSPTLVFAGDYYGNGLYRSTNAGDSWSLVLPNAAIRAVAGSPITPGLVLAGDRYTGTYRSLNWGSTWSLIAQTAGLTDTNVNVITFEPMTPYTAYISAGSSIFASVDGGLTWHFQGELPSSVYALVAAPLTPTVLFAGTYGNGVYTSTNDGITWMESNIGLPTNAWVTSLAIDPLTPTVVYAGTWEGQVYRSEDSGGTWTGLGYLGNVYALAAHPQAPNVIYAGTSNNGLFRGSTLDHITLDPISTTQYVNRPFTLTITACDALGFPLSGATLAQIQDLKRHDARLANTLAASYNGSAILTDTTGLITPTNVNLINGVAIQPIVFKQVVVSDVITSTLKIEGLQTASNSFRVRWFAEIALPLVMK